MENHEKHARIFKALCDEKRLMILALLREGEKCGCTLEEALPINQSTLSHHMKIMVESGIVEVRKDKKWSYYSISDQGYKNTKLLLETLLTKHYNPQTQCACKEA